MQHGSCEDGEQADPAKEVVELGADTSWTGTRVHPSRQKYAPLFPSQTVPFFSFFGLLEGTRAYASPTASFPLQSRWRRWLA